MELYQIRYFLALAETLNFTRASERSFVSQPALTKAIQRLEETLGGRLFDRTKTSVQLTDLGRAMMPNFRQIYDGSLQAFEQARQLTQDRKDTVRVGVMCTIDFQQLLPGFVASQEENDTLALEFYENSLGALVEALDRGDVDMGILCSPYEIPKRFIVTPLYPEAYVLAFGDDHRFNDRENIELTELHREHYCYRMDCEFSAYIEKLLYARGIALQVKQKSPREDWIQAFVRANFGVAFMPVSIAKLARLSHVTAIDCPITREVSVVVQAERALSPAQQAVIDSLTAFNWRSVAGPDVRNNLQAVAPEQ